MVTTCAAFNREWTPVGSPEGWFVARPHNSTEFLHSLQSFFFFLSYIISNSSNPMRLKHVPHNSVAPSTKRILQYYSRGELSGVTPWEVRVIYSSPRKKRARKKEDTWQRPKWKMAIGFPSPHGVYWPMGRGGHLISRCISIRGNGVQNILARPCESLVFLVFGSFFWFWLSSIWLFICFY